MDIRFDHAYVVALLSDDHPGIVSSICRTLARLGGNIDACSQTVLEGYFTLIMVVSVPEAVEPAALRDEVRAAEPRPGAYQVSVLPFDAYLAAGTRPETDLYVLTAFGEDRPGIVLRFTEYLAERDINIVDLYAERRGTDFLLIAQLEVPTALDFPGVQAEVGAIADDLGFTVRLQHEDVFVATNQLRLTGHAVP
jgi:glycine cleavage system transcriptional repressor